MGIGEMDRRGLHTQLQYNSQPSIASPSPLFPSNSDVRIVLRKKKEGIVRQPQPPTSTRVIALHRPNSTTSFNSLASIGLDNISWRNSSCMAELDRERRRTFIEDSKGTQLEQIRKEEMDLLENGQRIAERFVAWYRERREAAARKQRICSQNGHVIVESAVQEQQLNYLRANLAELNRRILAVMEKSEKGFPASVQAQKTNGSISQDEQIQWLKRTNRSLNQQLAERIKELEEMRRPKEIRPVSIHRPSAFVRPACQYFAPTQPVDSPTPVKAYDTLM